MRPLYIFDLDGTLADMEHRLHFIKRPEPDWRAFFAACGADTPIEANLTTLRTLAKNAEVWIWTGRSEEVREPTRKWLMDNRVFHPFWNPFKAPEQLLMRPVGDHRPDDVLKREWLSQLEPPEYDRLTAVFEDRLRVVQMWREAGITCYHVGGGEF